MIGNGRALGLVVARGGSKGLPGKSLLKIGGKPMVAWSVEAGLRSRYLDEVAISTDDPAIADAARAAGAQVPFLRPAELATDEASSMDVVLHALEHYEHQGQPFDWLALLQATSPLRTAEHIDAAVEAMLAAGAEAVVSVTEVGHHPLWSNTLPADRRMGSFLRPGAGSRRQEMEPWYRLNGAVYVAAVPVLRRERAFVGPFAVAYVMSPEASVDVDSALDLDLARVLIDRRGS